MKTPPTTDSVSIRPEVSVLSLFRHLNYKPWYAMAEFVDNALQSFLSNREPLQAVEDKHFKLVVQIEVDPADQGRITIRDNAAGINSSDFQRAFKPAEAPPDKSGLSEFGVGMKSAACWFAKYWTVRTSALDEDIERTISFDVDDIVRHAIEHLTPTIASAPVSSHYTEIVLRSLHNPLKARTITKIKEHLANIYRIFLMDEAVEIYFNNERLLYQEPSILTAAYYRTPTAEPVLWRKDIDLDFGGGLRVHGFAALRETGNTSKAGFALFRRQRLIQGSLDEGYRPEAIFRKSNSYTYQRLFGELHVEGFEVTHTKDGFRWEEHEDIFLEFLKEALDKSPIPLLDQAEGYRVRQKPSDYRKGAEAAVESTANSIEQHTPPVLEPHLTAEPSDEPPLASLAQTTELSQRIIDVTLDGRPWRIILELTYDPAIGDWVSISDQPVLVKDAESGAQVRQIGVRVSLAHPFMERYAGTTIEDIEPLVRVGAAIALAEVAARDSGVKMAGTMRRIINDLLRNALSKP